MMPITLDEALDRMKGQNDMTYKEFLVVAEAKIDEHHEILHRLISLVDALQDRVIRLEARVESIYSPESDEQPRYTH